MPQGLRISEAIALQAAHIDSQRMVIRVELGKGQKDRYGMLSPKLLEILRQWWRRQRPQHWLFPGKTSATHITAAPVQEACHEVLQQCRFPNPLPHTLRAMLLRFAC
jgi:integrase